MTEYRSERRELFGGAMSCSVPSTWRDVSQVRQVPDNQEVYQDCSEVSGAVVVIEILEHQSNVTNEDSASFFFDDLAESNGVPKHDVTIESTTLFSLKDSDTAKQTYFESFSLPTQQTESHACIAIGRQKSLKIEMCIVRLPDVTTDLLITVNIPNKEQGDLMTEKGLSRPFLDILATFCIKDWGLFVC